MKAWQGNLKRSLFWPPVGGFLHNPHEDLAVFSLPEAIYEEL